MRHLKKLTCLAALALSAAGVSAHAEVDDSFPWMSPGGTLASMSVMSREYSGAFGASGGGLTISSTTDVDYHVISCGTLFHPGLGVVSPGIISSTSIKFMHSKGDLDMVVYGVEGNALGSSQGVSDTETVGLSSLNRQVAVVKVFGYRGAINDYELNIVCK